MPRDAALDPTTLVVAAGRRAQMQIQVGRANLLHLLGRRVLVASRGARVAYVVTILLTASFRLFACAVLGRTDAMRGVAESTLHWLGLEVRVAGAPSGSDHALELDRRRLDPEGKGKVPCACGNLWVSNHVTLFDYTVLHLVSRQVLRTIVKADIAEEVPVLGPITALFLFRFMGCVPYVFTAFSTLSLSLSLSLSFDE